MGYEFTVKLESYSVGDQQRRLRRISQGKRVTWSDEIAKHATLHADEVKRRSSTPARYQTLNFPHIRSNHFSPVSINAEFPKRGEQNDVRNLNEKVAILGDRLLTLYDEIQKVFKILDEIKSTPILSPTSANTVVSSVAPPEEQKPTQDLRTSSYIEIHENVQK